MYNLKQGMCNPAYKSYIENVFRPLSRHINTNFGIKMGLPFKAVPSQKIIRQTICYKDTPLFHGIKSSCPWRTALTSMSPLATWIT